MRRSFTLGLTGLTLLAGCAAGTVEPTNGLPGTDTPTGPSDTTDAAVAVPTLQDSGGGGVPPHLGSDASTPPAIPKTPDDAGASHDAGGEDTYVPEDAGHKKDAGSSKETDSGSTSTTICKGYAPPDVTAGCSACKAPPCQANGCYGGYWCEMSADSCHEDPPSGCE